MGMVKTTIKLEDSLLKSIKKIAIDRNTTQNNLMNEYLEKGLKNELKLKKQEGKIKARIINNRLSKPKNTDRKYKNFEDMAGVIKTDGEVDGVELKRQIHIKEGVY
ncbi:MAG: ribbon-helix-helix domain-containing protein [Methanobrevibacter sp.]|jgi:hypothetical protein|nr:ribbon-helix-helix domain-containing protein [Candidatus Methanovirga australis]MDR2544262.1 ribbon-helix-helix domain-containing protein [Candidatus Methanovirga procula]